MKCFMIKAYKGNEFLGYLEDTDALNFVQDKEEAYVFNNSNDAMSYLDELKRNFKDYRFSLLLLDIVNED